MNKQQQARKAQLDQVMREYYYEKNETEDTLDFLVHMYFQYKTLLNNIKGNK